MINTNEKRLEKLRNYKISKEIKNLTREQLEHYATCQNQNYLYLYALIEDVYFSIRKNDCNSVEEVSDFLGKHYNEYISEKIPVIFGDVE